MEGRKGAAGCTPRRLQHCRCVGTKLHYQGATGPKPEHRERAKTGPWESDSVNGDQDCGGRGGGTGSITTAQKTWCAQTGKELQDPHITLTPPGRCWDCLWDGIGEVYWDRTILPAPGRTEHPSKSKYVQRGGNTNFVLGHFSSLLQLPVH